MRTPRPRRMRGGPALAQAALWAAAPACAGAAPASYVLGGAWPEAFPGQRLVLPALAYAAQFVVLSLVLARALRARGHESHPYRGIAPRRAALLVCASALVALVAYAVAGAGPRGDTGWILFLLGAAAVGLALATAAVRARPDRGPRSAAVPALAAAALAAAAPVDLSDFDRCRYYAGTIPLAGLPQRALSDAPPPVAYRLVGGEVPCGTPTLGIR